MILGLLLSPGDSLARQRLSGQLERLIEYYLKPYSRQFKRVIIFSYGNQDKGFLLPKNVTVVPIYRFDRFASVDVFRVFQAAGGMPAVIAKLILGKPYVATYGYDYVEFAKIEGRPILAGALKIVIPLVLRLADKIIVTDPKNLRLNRAELIPNGVDPLQFSPGKSKQPGLVLSVGRLVKQKNYSRLIQAVGLSRLRRRIKLVIIGRGPESARLIRLAKRNQVALKILPSVAHQQLINWYQRAEIFALTSKIEGQPKALLEAMSCGCACLTAPFSGNLIKDGFSGLIGTGAEQLARQLDRLLTQPGLSRQLGQSARQVVIKEHNIKPLVEKEIKLLKQC